MITFLIILLLIIIGEEMYKNSLTVGDIFVYIVDTFFRNYNSAYPVYSRFEIGSDNAECRVLLRQSDRLMDKYYEAREDEIIDSKKKGGKKLEVNNDWSEKTKSLYKKILEKDLRVNWFEKKTNCMIEINNKISLCKMSSDQVSSYASKKISYIDLLNIAEKPFNQWKLQKI